MLAPGDIKVSARSGRVRVLAMRHDEEGFVTAVLNMVRPRMFEARYRRTVWGGAVTKVCGAVSQHAQVGIRLAASRTLSESNTRQRFWRPPLYH